jgi:hypothetical protein
VRPILRFVLVALVGLLAACGGKGDDDAGGSGVPDRTRPVPADVRAFLDRVADPSKLAFTATYHLLTKNGGSEHSVAVASTPPSVRVTIDGAAIDPTDDAALSSFGIFSGFLAKNPSAAIEAAARRADAEDAVFTTRTAAGVQLRCIAVPVQGAQSSEACITPDGIFGFVDNTAALYELTADAVG